MALLGQSFSTEGIAPRQEYQPLPAGSYMMQIIASDVVPIKPKEGQPEGSDNGSYLKLEFEVMGGEYDRRKHFENLVLNHPSAQTVQIAQQTLAEICKACGKNSITDSEELHNIPVMAEMQVVPDRRNRSLPAGATPFLNVNRVKSFRMVEGGGEAGGAFGGFGGQGGGGAGAMPAGQNAAAASNAWGGAPGSGMAQAAQQPAQQQAAPATGNGLPWGKR